MKVVTLTGPTCSGKTTAESALQALGFGKAVSHTTRLPRANEIDGEAYHFVSDSKYNKLANSGSFIETVDFGKQRYAMTGASLWDALKEHSNVAIVVEPYGAEQIHEFCRAEKIESFAVWIDCSSEVQAARWLERMKGDMLAGKPVFSTYADRLATMLGVESSWRNRTSGCGYITCGPKEYDLLLDSGAESSNEIASRIKSLLTS